VHQFSGKHKIVSSGSYGARHVDSGTKKAGMPKKKVIAARNLEIGPSLPLKSMRKQKQFPVF
jgi:hypothetical protein